MFTSLHRRTAFHAHLTFRHSACLDFTQILACETRVCRIRVYLIFVFAKWSKERIHAAAVRVGK